MERLQIPIYFAAVFVGSAAGLLIPGITATLEMLIWPAVGLLLYFTFLQVPLLHFWQALRDVRFLAAILVANFLLVPLVVWLLLGLVPALPALQMGVALVLLTPCTDWMNTFTLLAQGDAHRTLAATPLLLVIQIFLLPLYLWLMLDGQISSMVATQPFVQAFAGLILLPLMLAWLTEWIGKRHEPLGRWIARSSPFPVVLLAWTLIVIAGSQIKQVLDDVHELSITTVVFILYLFFAAAIGWLTVKFFSLPTRAGRGVLFSVGTRNSFVVLPLALSLPADWHVAVAAIVIQAFVEMLGMVAFLWLVPGWLLPEAKE
ncbi:MAG TPA: bile acid:sodium symporter [Gemmatales bacterium]|nr:bile acid:sodium symporter [Gemmatales bacterium]